MNHLLRFIARVATRDVVIGVMGLGYVGLPLALRFAQQGFRVVGLDTDVHKVDDLRNGHSYIRHIPMTEVAAALKTGFVPTADLCQTRECDAILLCVPTPLTPNRQPDLRFVTASCEAVAATLRPGQLVVLESSTYPGTTRDVARPILERGGLLAHRDFFLAFSPEREDPNNRDHVPTDIPKVVGADAPESRDAAMHLYQTIVSRVVPVSSSRAAEATKMLENTFRAVNIALVNELKVAFEAMDIDIREVVEAAATKPFGFMRFDPGPGLGGHCIPIDPFYMAWQAQRFGVPTRLIEAAGEINAAMPERVVQRTARALSDRGGRLDGSRILLIGMAYKKNVDDVREAPALRLMEQFEARGARVAYHDPLVPTVPPTRDHAVLAGRTSVALDHLDRYDAVVVVTDHDDIDWTALQRGARLIVDTRGVFGVGDSRVVTA